MFLSERKKCTRGGTLITRVVTIHYLSPRMILMATLLNFVNLLTKIYRTRRSTIRLVAAALTNEQTEQLGKENSFLGHH